MVSEENSKMAAQYRFVTKILAIFFFSIHSIEMEASLVQMLQSDDPLERQSAAQNLINSRRSTIGELIAILGREDVDKSFQGTLHLSIEVLGLYRAGEAVSALSERIEFVPEGFETEEMIPTEYYYVAAKALADIGMPAIEEMVKVVAKSTPLKANLATWVIMETLGKDEAIQFLSKLRRERPTYDERFSKSIAQIENHKISFTRPNS